MKIPKWALWGGAILGGIIFLNAFKRIMMQTENTIKTATTAPAKTIERTTSALANAPIRVATEAANTAVEYVAGIGDKLGALVFQAASYAGIDVGKTLTDVRKKTTGIAKTINEQGISGLGMAEKRIIQKSIGAYETIMKKPLQIGTRKYRTSESGFYEYDKKSGFSAAYNTQYNISARVSSETLTDKSGNVISSKTYTPSGKVIEGVNAYGYTASGVKVK